MGSSYSIDLQKSIKMDRNINVQDSCSSGIRPLSIECSRTQNNVNEIGILSNQPRQPSNLQGVLRFAMEATKIEDDPNNSTVHPIDEERKRFLNHALTSMSVNVSDELQKNIKILQNIMELKVEDDPSEYEAALDRLADQADSMDIANDFCRIGGFSVFNPCLNSPHNGIRWRIANLIAELTQNNPFCQKKVLEAGYLRSLLNMIDSDVSELSRIKALYAVSCIIRGHTLALRYMENNDGFSVLMRAIQSPVQKLQIKSAFLLSSLCNKDKNDNLKLTLIKMGLIEQAAGLLAMESLLSETKEQLLSVLSELINNNYYPALKECRRPELCLKQTLEKHLQKSKVEENIDTENMCNELLEKIFTDLDLGKER